MVMEEQWRLWAATNMFAKRRYQEEGKGISDYYRNMSASAVAPVRA